ncbi:MAG: P-II family nitrogen regulator [Deltaproteobacteria bacterium]|jgi:nitrogen regulatory protein PII|nr:P-II family nitrogen regulator [Deltaproteobacteria bacterium]
MNLSFLPQGKLLLSLVGRRTGKDLVAVTKAAGARGGTLALGRAMANSRILQALSLADVMQDVVFTVMGDESEAIIDALEKFDAENPRKLGGISMVLNVYGRLAHQNGKNSREASQNGNHPGEVPAQGGRDKGMDSGYTLLTVIVNNGYGDDVMAAARKAGAKGGTILTARGTGTEEDTKFFGITLVPEKEILMIVAEKELVEPIVAAIQTIPTLNEPGGGIVYTMGVERFIVLGRGN